MRDRHDAFAVDLIGMPAVNQFAKADAAEPEKEKGSTGRGMTERS